MDSPQYLLLMLWKAEKLFFGFKPYYKWIVLNTLTHSSKIFIIVSFKPYYKWIVLNTEKLCTRRKNIGLEF